jgi:hypothetical protein
MQRKAVVHPIVHRDKSKNRMGELLKGQILLPEGHQELLDLMRRNSEAHIL